MAQSIPKSKQCLLTGIRQLVKFSKKNKRGFFLVWNDDTGLRHFGSPSMVKKFEETIKCESCEKNSWEEASKLDTLKLAKNEFEFDVGGNNSTEDILKAVYENDKVEMPLLPCPVDLMNQAQLLTYIIPELKLDYIEQGLLPVSRIPWGDPKFKPKCWAEDIWEWSKIGNIRQKQATKPDNGATIPDVLKATIKNRLKEKNIENPDEYISKEFSAQDLKKKHAIRGIKKLITAPTTNDDVEEASENTEETGRISEPIDEESDDSESESELERDGGTGRLILPSRSTTDDHDHSVMDINTNTAVIECPNQILSDVVEDFNDDNMEENSVDSDGEDPETRNISSVAMRVRGRVDSDGAVEWSKGRGKGGRKLRPTQGLLPKDRIQPRGRAVLEAKKLRRKDWSDWLNMYKSQTEALLKKIKKRDVKCPECNDLIQKKSFLKHRTERGCPRIDLRIKMSNWSVETYLN